MRARDQKGERTMAQECLIFLMALIVTFAICDCLQIISFKSRYKIEKSQPRHLDFCRNRVVPYVIELREINAILDFLCLLKEKLHCSCSPVGILVCTFFFLISRKTLHCHNRAYCLWSQRSLPESPLPVVLVFSPNEWDGWGK